MTVNPQQPDIDAEATTDVLASLSESKLLAVEELAKKCLIEGATLADVRGYTEDEMEAVYNFAHNAYRQRKYEEARQLFQFLVENDHAESRFWMGLAASYHMSGSYDQAVTAYGMAAVLDATNPRPAFHAGECYIAMKDSKNARKALDAVEFICGLPGASAHADLRKRAAVLSAKIGKANRSPRARAPGPSQTKSASRKNR